MSILETLKKINPAGWPEALTTTLIIILVAMGSFGLGRLSRIEELKHPIEIKGGSVAQVSSVSVQSGGKLDVSPNGALVQSSTEKRIPEVNEGFIVGSKTGKKYHFPWCSGAQRIKEENKIWFANEAEAKAAGFTPAANCRGLPQ